MIEVAAFKISMQELKKKKNSTFEILFLRWYFLNCCILKKVTEVHVCMLAWMTPMLPITIITVLTGIWNIVLHTLCKHLHLAQRESRVFAVGLQRYVATSRRRLWTTDPTDSDQPRWGEISRTETSIARGHFGVSDGQPDAEATQYGCNGNHVVHDRLVNKYKRIWMSICWTFHCWTLT